MNKNNLIAPLLGSGKPDHRSICIIGNLNMDLILRNVPALPVWGQEVNGTSHALVSSGQAGYLGFALLKLGVATAIIGNAGDDTFGQQIRRELSAAGIDVSGVILMPGGQTGITVGIVRPDGERAFVSNLGSSRDFNSQMAFDHWDVVDPAGVVCVVGTFCTPGMTPGDWAPVMARARQAGKITMLDTGWDTAGWQPVFLEQFKKMLAETVLFMPNLDEASAITGEKTPQAAAAALLAQGPEMVVIKCGAEGSYARCGDQEAFLEPRQVEVYDAVGAGDTFNAGFLYGLRCGWALPACLAFGNTIASLYISRLTDRFPLLEEVVRVGSSAYPVLRANAR